MPGAGEMILGLRITAEDMTKGAFRSADANTKKYTKSTKNQFKEMMSAATSYRKLVGSIVTAKVLSRGFAYLEQGIADVTTNIIEMDQALTAASAKFGPDVRRGNEAFREMEEITRKIAGNTEWTAQQTASGLDFLAMAGFDYAQAMKALTPLTDLATASQTDFARASDIASDALGAFNKSVAPDEIEESLTRINDVFAKTVTTSNTTMETLFDTMKLAGPVVKGGEVMFATLAGTLGSAGIKGTIAATTMKNMFLRLQAPPREAAKALKKLKVELDDGNGSMVSMIEVIGRLNEALAGKGEIQREKFLKDIFGMRAVAGATVLLREGKEELQDYYDLLNDSAGAAKEMADVMREGLGTQIKVLQSTLIGKGMDLFSQIMGEKDPAEAVRELTEAVREFDVSELATQLKEIGGMLKWGLELLWEHRELIKSIAKVYAANAIASKVRSFTGAVVGLTGALTGPDGLAKATMGATADMGKFAAANGKMLTMLRGAGPLISAAVAGLATGHEMWKWMERNQEKRDEERRQKTNRRIGAAFGRDEEGEDLTYIEARKQLAEVQRDWAKEEMAFKMSGQEAPDLLTGDMGKSREWKTMQEAAIGLTKRMDFLQNREKEAISIRNRMFGGESFVTGDADTSADYWRGQGFGESSAGRAEKEGRNISGQSMMPQIVFEPKQELGVTVNINNAPEGTTATATVDAPAPIGDRRLGAASG